MEETLVLTYTIYLVIYCFVLYGLNQIKKGGIKLFNASKELENKKLGNAGYFIYNGAKTLIIVMITVLAVMILGFLLIGSFY